MMTEKFSLKWNDYQSNWIKSLSELRKENDFADVTLVTDDKVKLPAHKILLSSCSNMFKFILKESTHANTLLYLSGVDSVNLALILDYIYYGEVKLYQEHIDDFLKIAQKLEIEGLIGNIEESKDTEGHQDTNFDEHVVKEQVINQPNEEKQIKRINDEHEPAAYNRRQVARVSYGARASANDIPKIDLGGMKAEEIEIKMQELYQKIDGRWSCLKCDYTTPNRGHMKYHIEIHLDGLSYNCSLCSKEFRSGHKLDQHKRRFHKI